LVSESKPDYPGYQYYLAERSSVELTIVGEPTMTPIQAGMLKAATEDYLARCAEVDALTDRLQSEALRNAWQALLRGDRAERDRICRAAMELPEKARAAKLEIGLRIGERIGVSREELERAVERQRRQQ
jgi:hypothetical protein